MAQSRSTEDLLNRTGNRVFCHIFIGRFTADVIDPDNDSLSTTAHVHNGVITTMAKRTADNAAIASALNTRIDEAAKLAHYVGANEFGAACIADFKATHNGLNPHEVMMAEYAGFSYRHYLQEVARVNSLNSVKAMVDANGGDIAIVLAKLAAQYGLNITVNPADVEAKKATVKAAAK